MTVGAAEPRQGNTLPIPALTSHLTQAHPFADSLLCCAAQRRARICSCPLPGGRVQPCRVFVPRVAVRAPHTHCSAPFRPGPGSCHGPGPPDNAPAPARTAKTVAVVKPALHDESRGRFGGPGLRRASRGGGIREGQSGTHLRHIASVGIVHDCPHARDRFSPSFCSARPLSGGCTCGQPSAEHRMFAEPLPSLGDLERLSSGLSDAERATPSHVCFALCFLESISTCAPMW